MITGPYQNTDRELWREDAEDACSPSVHVTADGMIGINVGGTVYVMNLRKWHTLARRMEIQTEGAHFETHIS